ncbi:MAG: metal-dependent transcriptional regulator [Oscillochloridaceae bacterium]|nr:metal-dependent transcriptional regulator [Chloroflexaceae bacterium]MDW8392362.1 metal-dependent transcriptional regulator [Oscillochloridaceae bacterium]
MSESVEMYLVMTALSRRAPDQPVAVSHLASRLGVTQVSAIEMCHKLSERGLMHYQPYKGVTLTEAGEAQAQAILSRRRLWVIFLVENLGIAPEEADDLACQLEHITSERLVTALKAFLERAPASGSEWEAAGEPEARPLDACAAGARGRLAALGVPPAAEAFLRGQGLAPGVEVEVQAIGADGAVLLAVEGRPVALAPALAAGITLAAAPRSQTRQEAWARCSAFWACLRGEARACAPGAPD